MTKPTRTAKGVGEVGKALREHIINVELLTVEMRKMLGEARSTLRSLHPFAPNSVLKVSVPYHMRDTTNDKHMSMDEILHRQIAEINALLGDER